MKSAILTTFQYGGAGIAAMRLHEGLRLLGVDNDTFVKFKRAEDGRAIQITSPEIQNDLIDRYVAPEFYKNIIPGNTLSSLTYPSVGFKYLDNFKKYDVINLHWISDFISLEAICKLDSMGKPLVWTLHDQNSFTGACHYTHGCEKYKIDCNDCPQLANDSNIPAQVLEAKLKYLPQDITIISPSQWLADCARKSKLFRNNKIVVIRNSINTSLYSPYDKASVKEALDLPKNGKVIMLGAWDLYEKRKGTAYFIEAFQYLRENKYINDLIEAGLLHIVTIGDGSSILQDVKCPFKAMGNVEDEKMLAQIYSCSDVFALPSLEDNLPNTMLESLSCGTPVVAFRCGGMQEIIQDGQTGYLSEFKNAKDFADKLVLTLQDDRMPGFSRSYSLQNFKLKQQATLYQTLFEEVLKASIDKKHTNASIPIFFNEMTDFMLYKIIDASILQQKDIDCLKNEKDQINHTLLEVDGERNVLIKDKKELEEAISYMQEKNDQLQGKYDQYEEKISYKDKAISNLQSMIDILKNEKADLFSLTGKLSSELNKIQTQNDEFSIFLEMKEEQVSQLTEEIHEYEEITRLSNIELEKFEQLKIIHLALNEDMENIQRKLNALLNSTSWKLTKPFRFISIQLKRLLKLILPYEFIRFIQSRKNKDRSEKL